MFMGVNLLALSIVIIGGMCFFFFYKVLSKRSFKSGVGFSSLSFFKKESETGRVRYIGVPRVLSSAAFIFFILAFIDPYFLIDYQEPIKSDRLPFEEHSKEGARESVSLPVEGVALYLVLDVSGSMNEGVLFPGSKGERFKARRVDILKEITTQFVRGNESLGLKGRSNDLIGLIFFARTAQVIAPLTLDHERILDELVLMDTVKRDDENGTAIAYALFKTVNLIKATHYFSESLLDEGERPSYAIKSTAIILVTDGIQEPNPKDLGHPLRTMDLKKASHAALEAGVKVYVVNINPDVRFARFAQAKEDLENVAHLTGGKFFIADDPQGLSRIYAAIDQMESDLLPGAQQVEAEVYEKKKPTTQGDLEKKLLLYPYLISVGVICLALSLFLENTLLRRVQ
jgi:Ca-activated chloride channel homolog